MLKLGECAILYGHIVLREDIVEALEGAKSGLLNLIRVEDKNRNLHGYSGRRVCPMGGELSNVASCKVESLSYLSTGRVFFSDFLASTRLLRPPSHARVPFHCCTVQQRCGKYYLVSGKGNICQ